MNVSHAEFTLERRYDHSRERAYSAFADPDLKRQWFANPGNWANGEWSLDFRVGGTEISIVLTNDAHIRALNREWREKDKATNVLSFPAMPVRPGVALPPLLGDIVLAAETIRREAGLEDKPFEHHLIHLMVHGFLHIVGYDHETDAEAEEMEAAERRILARLAIPDPYG